MGDQQQGQEPPDLPHDLDLPFEEVPGGPLDRGAAEYLLAGGVFVEALTVPTPAGVYPALGFRFQVVDGSPGRPVILLTDDDQLGKLPALVSGAATAARRAARQQNRANPSGGGS